MITKKLFACLLLATSMITGIYAGQTFDQDIRSAKPSEMKQKSDGCKPCKNGKDGKDGKAGKDGKDGSCCCEDKGCDKKGVETAFFFLRPSDISSGPTATGDVFIPDGSPIIWEYDLFTVKSNGINIGGVTSGDINISHKGIYLITWTIFADTEEVDWISAQLVLNGTPVRGTQFTAVTPDDAAELVGQAVLFIPKDSTLNLVNTTGYGIGFTTENEGGVNGNVASIAITKIGDSVE